MIKLQIKYKTEAEKKKMINLLSNGAMLRKISEPYKTGMYYRVYIDIE